MTISTRLAKALALAEEAHDGQVRKGTTVPYIAHPMAVATLVLECGGNEDQAVAALLHDAIEDGGSAYAKRINAGFGREVLALVEACTDGTAESKAKPTTLAAKKADWKRRKLDYLKRLETADPLALLIMACDKLHNARAVVTDLEEIGLEVFDRFTTGRDGTLWYYSAAATSLRKRGSPLAGALEDTVRRMKELAVDPTDTASLAKAFQGSLNPHQRAGLKALVAKLESNAQRALRESARGLSQVSANQQALMTLQMAMEN